MDKFEIMQRYMNKFKIVKKYIDEYDYYGLLACGAPEDEYDSYSQILANRISEKDSIEDIAVWTANILNPAFGEEVQPENFIKTARKIKEALMNREG